jgi:hypothetical protein
LLKLFGVEESFPQNNSLRKASAAAFYPSMTLLNLVVEISDDLKKLKSFLICMNSAFMVKKRPTAISPRKPMHKINLALSFFLPEIK